MVVSRERLSDTEGRRYRSEVRTRTMELQMLQPQHVRSNKKYVHRFTSKLAIAYNNNNNQDNYVYDVDIMTQESLREFTQFMP